MKYASLLCLLCLLFMAVTCKKSDKKAAELVGKTWLHSFEEDEDGVWAYRPNSFDFPPSRGRTGFTLEPGGVIKRYEIAPTDGLTEEQGQWEHLEDGLFLIRMAPGSNPPLEYQLQIVSLDEDLLKVRRVE
ncbi:hypothetical protein [Pontibacter actiniarum]|uniref:Lipocalin-like domain-containing protein n=1 Tax=Pontibacter actiniarum TaxID=323450 RepID=A0A1X9YXZ0_9BACT|nr:hypothetical protein [Pontibacter actiniarum]ARS37614.1 hypothetical protein CA264_20490 [Pontibacter actiniarum]